MPQCCINGHTWMPFLSIKSPEASGNLVFLYPLPIGKPSNIVLHHSHNILGQIVYKVICSPESPHTCWLTQQVNDLMFKLGDTINEKDDDCSLQLMAVLFDFIYIELCGLSVSPNQRMTYLYNQIIYFYNKPKKYTKSLFTKFPFRWVISQTKIM